MKLIKTIKKIIKEAEEQYNTASETNLPLEEIDRLEKHYKDSLKLLKLYKNKKIKDDDYSKSDSS
jgi:replication-associated recombination protein RarA